MATDWQPIETAPKDDRQILILLSGGAIIIAPALEGPELTSRQRLELAKIGEWPDYKNFTRTHWMPLPPRPGDHD